MISSVSAGITGKCINCVRNPDLSSKRTFPFHQCGFGVPETVPYNVVYIALGVFLCGLWFPQQVYRSQSALLYMYNKACLDSERLCVFLF